MNSAGHPRIIMLIFAVLLHELQEACFCFPSLRLLYGSRQEPFASFLNRKEAVLRAQAMSLWVEPASPVTEERKPFARPGYAHVRGAETVERSMSSTSNTRTSAGVSRHSI